MTPEDKRDDFSLWWGVAIVIAGQVPSSPSVVRGPVLSIVFWAQDFVQAEEQEDQEDPGGQAQSSNPNEKAEVSQLLPPTVVSPFFLSLIWLSNAATDSLPLPPPVLTCRA